jgi:hypothetical protein
MGVSVFTALCAQTRTNNFLKVLLCNTFKKLLWFV